MEDPHPPPNHHAEYPGFAGVGGLIAALSMVLGRKSDAQIVARLSGLVASDTVVDLGCGPGVAARYAARLGARSTGVDPAPVMLRVANLLTWPSAKVEYVRGTAEAIPLREASATVIWSIATVHHWSEIDSALGEVRRVLRPGGHLVAMERSAQPGAKGHASHGWTPEQASGFADRCRKFGFDDVRLDRSKSGRRSMVSVLARAP